MGIWISTFLYVIFVFPLPSEAGAVFFLMSPLFCFFSFLIALPDLPRSVRNAICLMSLALRMENLLPE